METRFCKICSCEHPLTEEFWYWHPGKDRNPAIKCREGMRQQQAKWKQENKDKLKIYADKSYKKHKASRIKRVQEYVSKNKEKRQEYAMDYYRRNKEKIIKGGKSRPKTVNEKISHTLRERVRNMIKQGRCGKVSAVSLLGCSLDMFRKHLESQFVKGMSWENYGLFGWHMDHIKPLGCFDLTDPLQCKEAMHYTNIRPLWAIDNLRRAKPQRSR